jgi:iron complex transport system substrate-binding protein
MLPWPKFASRCGMQPDKRIVSLLASATEIVCALGAGEMLVARSHECDNPDWVRKLPSCSEPAFDVSVSSMEIDTEVRRRIRSGEPLYHIDGDLIRDLRPDLLITQAHCEVCAVTPGDIERSSACTLSAQQIALSASTLDDIFKSIRQISQALGLQEQGEALVRREQQRLDMVREKAARFRRPTVVMLEWTDPLFAMGNWGPELVEIANGELLLGKKGEYSAAIPAEQLRDADPEYLIVAPCGFNLERSLQEQAILERYPWWQQLQAVRKGNLVFADGNLFFNRSGMTISQTAEIIAEIMHGISFGGTSSAHWRRLQTARA